MEGLWVLLPYVPSELLTFYRFRFFLFVLLVLFYKFSLICVFIKCVYTDFEIQLASDVEATKFLYNTVYTVLYSSNRFLFLFSFKYLNVFYRDCCTVPWSLTYFLKNVLVLNFCFSFFPFYVLTETIA